MGWALSPVSSVCLATCKKDRPRARRWRCWTRCWMLLAHRRLMWKTMVFISTLLRKWMKASSARRDQRVGADLEGRSSKRPGRNHSGSKRILNHKNSSSSNRLCTRWLTNIGKMVLHSSSDTHMMSRPSRRHLISPTGKTYKPNPKIKDHQEIAANLNSTNKFWFPTA